MKRSELEEIIREEIKGALKEDTSVESTFGNVTFMFDTDNRKLAIRVGKDEVEMSDANIENLADFIRDKT